LEAKVPPSALTAETASHWPDSFWMDTERAQQLRQLVPRQLAWLPILVETSPFTPLPIVESDQCLQQDRTGDAINIARPEDGPDISKQAHPWVFVERICTQGECCGTRGFTVSEAVGNAQQD